jgi:simple sugar transport system substrate-binding protein
VERSTAGQREGAVYLAELNLQIPETIRTLIKQRYEEMKELIFEPFTGPIRDKDGVLKVEEGRRMDHDELWSIDWFVEGIVVA